MKLTDRMLTALRALQRGPIDYRPDGWISRAGVYGPWNTHTLQYLGSRGLVDFQPRVSATLSREGRQFLERTGA